MRIGSAPPSFHSPVKMPNIVALITISDMNKGHPRIGPQVPSWLAASPYNRVLPNQRTAIIAASAQCERPIRYLDPERFRFISQAQYTTFGTAPASSRGSQITLIALGSL